MVHAATICATSVTKPAFARELAKMVARREPYVLRQCTSPPTIIAEAAVLYRAQTVHVVTNLASRKGKQECAIEPTKMGGPETARTSGSSCARRYSEDPGKTVFQTEQLGYFRAKGCWEINEWRLVQL